MKILHVTPSFYPATYYGGPIYSTYALCNALAANPEIELRVLTTDTAGLRRVERLPVDDFPIRMPAGYNVYYCRRLLGADIAPGLIARLWGMIRWTDVVQLTAVYSPPTIPTLLLCALLRKPVVWSTRGALQPWSRGLKKNIWDKICNSLCRPNRVVLHATSETESLESLKRISRARAVVIPNGVDVPNANAAEPTKDGEFRLLYLGRLHPIKGLENLLRAMARVPANVKLSICGDGQAVYREKLETLTLELGLSTRVNFHGQVEGEIKEQCFKEADWCVVPSFQENFCMVVAEALARGVPVIASRGTPWARVEEIGCGLWIDNDEGSLADAITRAANLHSKEMGQRGREWMKREFSWTVIAEQMLSQYQELIEATAPIATVEKVRRQAA